MQKGNGWIFYKKGVPFKGKVVTRLIWVGGKTYCPCFTSLEKLQQFGDMLQAIGIDMSIYEVAEVIGVEDPIIDPDPYELYPRILASLQ